MSKKQKIKGRKLKNIFDVSLSHPHPAGTPVYIIQPSIDPKWGRYWFKHYKRYLLFFLEGQRYFKKTFNLLKKCREIKVDEKQSSRFIPEGLRNKLELNSIQFLVFIKLGFEYFTTEYLTELKNIRTNKGEVFYEIKGDMDLIMKLKIVMKNLELNFEIPGELSQILTRRDIAEHPNLERIYDSVDWKNNHLAWVLSGELENLFEKIVPFINTLIENSNNYVQNNQIPGKLEVSRGMKAAEPFKKA